MPDPYNRTLASAEASDDPFEISLTTRDRQLVALKAVKSAQDDLRAAQARAARGIEQAEGALVVAMTAASQLGAYELLPVNLRPAVRVAS